MSESTVVDKNIITYTKEEHNDLQTVMVGMGVFIPSMFGIILTTVLVWAGVSVYLIAISMMFWQLAMLWLGGIMLIKVIWK